MPERRFTGVELRAEGRRLTGTVMRYGDTSPSHRERFEPGSLRMAEAVHLDLFHDPERAVAWFPGGGLKLDNGRQALAMRAQLPPIPAADLTVCTPARSSASYFASAVPLPPETIAPAWPMRRPGGAVTPAM